MSGATSQRSDASVSAVTDRVAESSWGDRAMRVGMASRGVAFVLFAYLVARVALGALGEPSTSKPANLTGVPDALAAAPGGRPPLVVLAVGLELYALFSLVDAIRHHNDETPAAKRWGDRFLSGSGFVLYAGFGVYSLSVALSGSSSNSSKDRQQQAMWSSKVLRWPAGWLWLGLLAAILVGAAGFLASRALRRSFRDRLERRDMDRRTWRLAVLLGTAGYLGRAGLFAIVGGCIMSAAVENDPTHGQGVDGSVRILAANPAGTVLLWALAAALVAYGLYVFMETRYRKV